MIPSERRKTKDLSVYPLNPGEHPEPQIQELHKSLTEFDQFKNIIIWHDQVIAGKGVYLAACHAGLQELEVKDYSHLSETDAQRLCLADRALPAGGFTHPERIQEILSALPSVEDIPGVNEEWLVSLGATIPDIGETDIQEDFSSQAKTIKCPKCNFEWIP